jgi:type IV pilus assembly protein PilQ
LRFLSVIRNERGITANHEHVKHRGVLLSSRQKEDAMRRKVASGWVALLCAFTASTVGALQLNDILVRSGAEGTEVVLQSDGPLTIQPIVLNHPMRLVLDCRDTRLAEELQSLIPLMVNRGGIESITASQFTEKNHSLRLVVELKEQYPYSLVPTGNGAVLRLLKHGASFESWQAIRGSGLSEKIAQQNEPVVLLESAASPVGGSTGEYGGRAVSLDFENADILTVLRGLAEYSGRDIVVGSEVKGNVTVRLHNVPWRRALDQILKAAGLGATEEGGVIRVSSLSNLKSEQDAREQGEPRVTKVYKLEYAVANELKTPIQNTLSPRGKMDSDSRSNTIVVTEITSNQGKIAELVRLLDSATPQVEIAAKIMEVNVDAARALGITWTLSGIQSWQDNYNIGLGVTAPPSEVAIGKLTLGTVRSFAQLTATLEALERESKASTISSPRISATNNKQAVMFGGKKVPIVTRDVSGNLVAQYIDAGVKLTVTPNINSLEDVTITMVVDVSEPDLSSLVLGLPVITTTTADSRMVLKDGETVVCGGLKKTTTKKSERGIPILMKIPILGYLFKSSTVSKEDREILIFITPHIIRPS